MATTTVDVSAGEVAAHPTLTANVVEVVNFTRAASAAPFYTPNPIHEVQVVNRGADTVWVTLDGSVPTVGGRNSYVVTAGSALREPVPSRSTNTIRLLAASAVAVSVVRVS